MKILSAEITNFGSYGALKFEFDGLGLALVSGPTGAGKSTLLDIIPWCLFGVTSKKGAVDDVRSWQSNAESTTGRISVRTGGSQDAQGDVTVCRTRGLTGSNDLYWMEGNDEKRRGNDLNDTQRLLEQRLGISVETFLTATYFHEFSGTGNFFVSSAKSRRELFERVCDLSFPLKLSTAANDLRRRSKSTADAQLLELSTLQGRLEQLQQSATRARAEGESWAASHLRHLQEFEAKAASFETDKVNRIEALVKKAGDWQKTQVARIKNTQDAAKALERLIKSPEQLHVEEAEIRAALRCPQCRGLPETANEQLRILTQVKFTNHQHITDFKWRTGELRQLLAVPNPFHDQVKAAEESENTFSEALASLKNQTNPFTPMLGELAFESGDLRRRIQDLQDDLTAERHQISGLTRLVELTGALRGELLRKSVREIESQTNQYLEKHFDAEIKVGFTAGDGDDIPVTIQKSGYECNYKQLSRGQRSLLRLAFAVSVMKAAANATGFYPSILMFDECLDGQDVDLKVKAVSLFQQLATEYSTVLVVDHATEVKAAFTRTFEVELVGDVSQIHES